MPYPENLAQPELQEIVTEMISAERRVICVFVALAASVIYDHLTTLDEEIDLIWTRPKLSPPHVLFLVNRYLGDVTLVYVALKLATSATGFICGEDPITTAAWMGFVVLWAMQGIMVYRVAVIFHFSRKIVSVLVMALTSEIVSVIVIQAMSSSPEYRLQYPPIESICVPSRPARWIYYFWFPILMFECLVLSLSMRKGLQYWSELRGGDRVLPTSTGGKPLIWILLRDSILFPTIALSISLENLIGWNYTSGVTSQINLAVCIFAARILGSRLVLNLREAYYCPFQDEYAGDLGKSTHPLEFTSAYRIREGQFESQS